MVAETSTRRLELWTRGLVSGIAALSVAVVWIAFLASTLGERLRSEEVQAERLQRSTAALAEGLNHLLGDSRLALELLIRQVAAHPEADAVRSPEFLSLVQAVRYRGVEPMDLRAVSSSGERLVFDGPSLAPESLSDHPFFSAQVPFPGKGFLIDPPRKENETSVLYLTQSVPPHQGDLAVLAVVLPSTRIDLLVSNLYDAPGDTVEVYRDDGVLLYRHPQSSQTGSLVSEIRSRGADAGRLEGQDLRVYHRVPSAAAWVVLSRQASNLGDEWVGDTVGQGVWVVLLTSFVLAATLLLLRLMGRLRLVRLEQEKLARSDPLTGLANRRAFLERCDLERTRALRSGEPLCLLLLDLDRFKQVNDRFGHQEGDRVLKALAEVLVKTLRTSDAVARIGGEEFAILLPATALEAGLETAERVRVGVATIALPEGFQTSSLGLAIWDGQETFDAWYQRADRALYHAKEEGRNRVVRAP